MTMRAAIAVAAILASLWGGWLVRGTYDRAQAARALEDALKVRDAMWGEAVRMLDRQRAVQRAVDAEAVAVMDDLNKMEGGDAPVSDYLRAAGERLWGKP
jgi:hypothetical protein